VNLGPFQILIILVEIFFAISPGFVAFRRDHPEKVLIAVVGVILGFTIIGWALLIFWATRTQKEQHG
jgi:TRAP-type uncharacterized transport system fused permease subunit